MNRSHLLTSTVAWPTCALGAWAAAWTAGRCSPDDVAEALAETADEHVLHRPDDASADGPARTGVLELLTLLRTAQSIVVRLPSTGDPQGLPPGDATAAALTAGEVLLLNASGEPDATLALVPHVAADAADPRHVVCHWTLRHYPERLDLDALAFSGPSAGDLEYELRQAVRQAAEIVGGIGGRRAVDLSDLRVQLSERTARHQVALPPHTMDARVTRLIDTAAQIEAIVELAGAWGIEIGATAGQWESGDSALRSLATLTRSARAAAVNSTIAELLRR